MYLWKKRRKKGNKTGAQKGQQLPFPFRSSIPEVSIHIANATLLPSSPLRIVCRHCRLIFHQIDAPRKISFCYKGSKFFVTLFFSFIFISRGKFQCRYTADSLRSPHFYGCIIVGLRCWCLRLADDRWEKDWKSPKVIFNVQRCS